MKEPASNQCLPFALCGSAKGECGPVLLRHKWFPSVLTLENGGNPPHPTLHHHSSSSASLSPSSKPCLAMQLNQRTKACSSDGYTIYTMCSSLGPIWNSFPSLLSLKETTPPPTPQAQFSLPLDDHCMACFGVLSMLMMSCVFRFPLIL